MARAFVVVGSGPSGLYCAEKLVRDDPSAEVDVIERWPVPFGLVRSGVAADHQVTKAVTRVLERPLGSGRIAFLGNVELGRDVALDELSRLYDAVILATGAPADRRLDVPGEALPGVVPSGAFVAWANGVPGAPPPPLDHARNVIVIGNGNVALDVVRLLAKTAAEFDGSDLDPAVAAALAAAPVERIRVIGRRGPAEVAFSQPELAEIARVERARPHVDARDVPPGDDAEEPACAVLRAWSDVEAGDGGIAIDFRFGLAPERILGRERVEAVQFRRMAAEGGTWRPTEATEFLPADLVVTCIGYAVDAAPVPLADGRIANQDGRVADGVYVAGWAKRGPSGTIATNRAEAHAVATRVLAETGEGGGGGGTGLRALLSTRGVAPIDWARWRAIDAAERARAPAGRVRRKFTALAEMLAVHD
jgi:ferredoxin--NADP+ reductase